MEASKKMGSVVRSCSNGIFRRGKISLRGSRLVNRFSDLRSDIGWGLSKHELDDVYRFPDVDFLFTVPVFLIGCDDRPLLYPLFPVGLHYGLFGLWSDH